jgi:membrane protease YdiL (CAAX protease family)
VKPVDGQPVYREASHVLWTLTETVVATALALYLSQRLHTSLFWLLLPFCSIFASRRSPSEFGLDLRICPPPLRVHAVLGLTLLVFYSAGYTAISALVLHKTIAPQLPTSPLADLARGFLIVAFPEEVFFRAYVQSRWDIACGKPWHLFGAFVGPGLVVQAMLFAACHLAAGDWTRLRVFFFALLVGWLRARSGSVLGPAVYHAVANLWAGVLAASFR